MNIVKSLEVMTYEECFEDICLVHLTEEDTKRRPHHGLQLHPWGLGGERERH